MESMPTVAIAHADQLGGAMDILEKWAQELKAYATEIGYTVIDICGSDLTYEGMTRILRVTKPALLVNFSLGTPFCLIGNDMKCTLTDGEDIQSCTTPMCTIGGEAVKPWRASNLKVVEGMAVISYSSQTAKQLGLDIIKAGSPCFVGFSDLLIIVSDKYGAENVFKESLLPLAERMLQQWTVGAAVEATRSNLTDAHVIQKNVLISKSLLANKKSLKYFGDPNWKLKAGGI